MSDNSKKKKKNKKPVSDFEIISLDGDEEITGEPYEENEDSQYIEQEDYQEEKPSRDKYIHYGFLAIIAIIVITGTILLINWSKGKEVNTDPSLLSEDYRYESIDHFSYFTPYDYEGYVDDGQLNIVYLCDQYTYTDCEDSIPDLIADKTGGNVTVLYMPNERVCTSTVEFDGSCYEDGYSLYMLSVQMTSTEDNPYGLMASCADNTEDRDNAMAFSEAFQKVDFSKVDILIIGLGCGDFYAGLPLMGSKISEVNPYGINDGFTAAYMMSLNRLKEHFPTMQIILTSPSFFYEEDADGNLVPAYDLNNGVNNLGQFIANVEIASEGSRVSFVDNFFGAEYTEENFTKYLEEDNVHPNKEGRQMIADHIIQFMYFNN